MCETELDSLATALHVKTDDLLKDSPHLTPRPSTIAVSTLHGRPAVTAVRTGSVRTSRFGPSCEIMTLLCRAGPVQARLILAICCRDFSRLSGEK